MSDCHVRLGLCDFLELKEYQLIDMAPSFTRPLATTARCMSITRSNIDMTSASFKNQRSTDNSAVKFDPILGLTWRVGEYISPAASVKLTGARLRNTQRVFFANRPCR
ncbi:hypothetical protein BDR06DRAFT_521437 [Suillus hirtellus]|nr:hypothetical protein BDR06DRAFT_521437 [Suillus hirtellus]